MHRGIQTSLISLAWLTTSVIGCATSPIAETETDPAATQVLPERTVVRVDANQYDATFDAAVRILRDKGFRIARRDRRFGVITTFPKESPTMFEPWVGDNTTSALARRSTIDQLRRRVEVTLAPSTQPVDLDQALSSTNAGESATQPSHATYQLSIRVTLERRQEPSRYLTHSARRRIVQRYREVPVHYEQRGIPAEYWEAAGEDPQLAEQLVEAVAQRSRDEQADHPPTTDPAQAP